ncbi:uncharacterized protein LOC126307663 [Schistocerca gregaria]|uniref:uncharacterized protein LOC126307663 n=1 Tax=Schistocerca gregaria TaxID=7010 RepID=UPI00211DFBB8|nr:uncharacterized protein LOC126307663 [Schistocerca gregaria]
MDTSVPDSDSVSVSVSEPPVEPSLLAAATTESVFEKPVVDGVSPQPVPMSAEIVPHTVPVTEPDISAVAPTTVPDSLSAASAVVEREAFTAPKPRRDRNVARASGTPRLRSASSSASFNTRGFSDKNRSPSPVARAPAPPQVRSVGQPTSRQPAARDGVDLGHRPSQGGGSRRHAKKQTSSRTQPEGDVVAATQKRDIAVQHLKTFLSQPTSDADSGMAVDPPLSVTPSPFPTKRKAEDSHLRRAPPSTHDLVPPLSSDVEMPAVEHSATEGAITVSGTPPPPPPLPSQSQDWSADVEAGRNH